MNKKNNLKKSDIHSFDAYYRNVIFRNSNLLVPYINLGFIEHELNRTSEIMYLDRAYLIAENLTYFRVYEKEALIGDSNQDGFFFFGGRNLDHDHFVDLEFNSESVYLMIPDDSKLSHKMWVPIETPLFNPNLTEKVVDDFFDYKNLAADVKKIFFNCSSPNGNL